MPKPPMESDDAASHREMMVRDMLALVLVSGVGPVTIRKLLDEFGTASAAIRAGESRLKAVDNVGPKLAEKIARALDNSDIDKEIAMCNDHQVAIMLQSDENFPECLLQMPDCPAMLFVKGRIEPIDRLAVAVVGSRRSTQYGRRMADKLATSLARSGMTVVSGLARGIDEAAHRGALNGDKYPVLETLILKGTAYAQVIPFKRDSWCMKIA